MAIDNKPSASTSTTSSLNGDVIEQDQLHVNNYDNRPATWKTNGVLGVLGLGLLLATIETSITATALVSISEYFDNYTNSTWVVLVYLLTYMGFSTIFTTFSDAIGRLNATILAWLLFAGFSLGAGLSQSLNQLIACRTLQGIGGSGLYSMTMVCSSEIVRRERFHVLSSFIGIMLAIGSVLGPILGGAITTTSTWRWIYLYNAPCAMLAIPILLYCWPNIVPQSDKQRVIMRAFRRIDILGAGLLLSIGTLVVVAIQEAGAGVYAWNSGAIIACLVATGLSIVALLAWITWLSLDPNRHSVRPIIPIDMLFSRPMGPALLTVFLTGFPYMIAVINLPQRFQISNGESPIKAGVHLLPLLCGMALGSAIGGGISRKHNLTGETMVIAASLILTGCGLLSTLNEDVQIDHAVYGYQIILGIGTGMSFGGATVMAKLENSAQNHAIAQGAMSQARMLGGSIGLAVSTVILNHKLDAGLSASVDSSQLRILKESLTSLGAFPVETRLAVGTVFSQAVNSEMRLCLFLSIACFISACATVNFEKYWHRRVRSINVASSCRDMTEV